MKNYMILLAVLFTGFVNANEITPSTTNNLEITRYDYMQPLKFVERGVEFYVFPNGEFDFNTHPRDYNRGRSVQVNINYGTTRSRNRYHTRNRVNIEHDHLGRVRRIGNVFINYDRNGRIKRVGSVYMSYHHHMLDRIGGLHIYYDNYHRIIRTSGYIKSNTGCHFCGGMSCNINHYTSNNNWNDHNSHDDHYSNDDSYYYKKNKKRKHKR